MEWMKILTLTLCEGVTFYIEGHSDISEERKEVYED